MAGGQAAQFGIEEIERLLLNDVIDFVIELEIVGVDGVEGTFEPLMNSIFGGLPALLERINLEALAEHL